MKNKIMQIEDLDFIHLGPLALVDNVLQDLHNSSHHMKTEFKVILFYYSFKIIISKFSTSLTSCRLLSKHLGLFLGMVSGCKQIFFLADAP